MPEQPLSSICCLLRPPTQLRHRMEKCKAGAPGSQTLEPARTVATYYTSFFWHFVDFAFVSKPRGPLKRPYALVAYGRRQAVTSLKCGLGWPFSPRRRGRASRLFSLWDRTASRIARKPWLAFRNIPERIGPSVTLRLGRGPESGAAPFGGISPRVLSFVFLRLQCCRRVLGYVGLQLAGPPKWSHRPPALSSVTCGLAWPSPKFWFRLQEIPEGNLHSPKVSSFSLAEARSAAQRWAVALPAAVLCKD